MSKIGDLIVKLRLDGKDYQKGLKNAEAKTKGMAGQFGKIVGGIKMGWAAIGAAVVAVGSEMIKSTNKFGDAWNRTMGGAKASWQTFKTAVMNWDFTNLRGNMKESFKAGKELADTLDGVFEVENSIKLRQAQNQSTLEAYRQDLMDTNLAIEDRIKAGEKYLAFMKKQSDTEIALRKKTRDATINKWLSVSGTKASISDVVDFFTNYTGEDSSVAKKYPNLANNYQMQNDEKNGAVVSAIYEYLAALSAWDVENRGIIHRIRELNGKLEEEGDILAEIMETLDPVEIADELEAIPDVINFSALDTSVDISAITEYIDNWEANVKRFQEIMDAYRNACIYGFSDGTQYLMDALFQIEKFDAGTMVAKLLEPLADLTVKEGELIMAQGAGMLASREAFKNPYTALAAGAAMVAIGAAAKAGLSKLAASGGTSSATTTSAASSADTQKVSSEMTIYVKGTIKGSDIVISGNNTTKNWSR